VPESKLPNFFVVGAGKAGTTSLYHYLRQHPQIYMSPIKEPCYFAAELRAENLSPDFARHIRRQTRALPGLLGASKPVKPLGWLVSDWDDYLRLFENVQDEKAI
jgi:Sulfotransferase family